MSFHWRIKDARHLRESYVKLHQWIERPVIFMQFVSQVAGDGIDVPATLTFRKRREYVFVEDIPELDNRFDEQWATGEILVFSLFDIKGADFRSSRPADRLIYLNAEWVVADQPSPIQAGVEGPILFYKTVMRRTDRRLDTDVPAGELIQVSEAEIGT